MSECNGAAPHDCPQCGEPAYLGFGVPAKCVQRGCVFYDAGLWCEWVMLIPDDGIPKDSEPDYFDDEDTNPGIGTPYSTAHPWGAPLKNPPGIGYSQPQQPTLGLPQTYAKHLDDWGAVLGVDRQPNETDDNYKARILKALGRYQ